MYELVFFNGNYSGICLYTTSEFEYDSLKLNSIQIPFELTGQVLLNGKQLKTKKEGQLMVFEETAILNHGDLLKIE